jgi:Fe-S-cluster containining protein
MSTARDPAAPSSPVIPVQLGLDDKIRFRCHKGIPCFNKCCENIDILLTPYDIVRLKNRLGLTSREFIDRHTVDCEMDGHGMPGLKLKTQDGSTACINLTPDGCSVYSDRPAACRYYALGLASMRSAISSRRCKPSATTAGSRASMNTTTSTANGGSSC